MVRKLTGLLAVVVIVSLHAGVALAKGGGFSSGSGRSFASGRSYSSGGASSTGFPSGKSYSSQPSQPRDFGTRPSHGNYDATAGAIKQREASRAAFTAGKAPRSTYVDPVGKPQPINTESQ